MLAISLLNLSFFGFINASSKKFVSFDLPAATNEIEVPDCDSLIESLKARETGSELLKEMNEIFQTELTCSRITAYLVSGSHADELSALRKFLVIDEFVLHALNYACQESNLYHANRLFQAFPALVSQESLLILAGNFDSFNQLLHLSFYCKPHLFINSLNSLKKTIDNEQNFMNLMWCCLSKGLALGACRNLSEKLKVLNKVVIEFVICTKTIPFTARAELDSLFVEVKMILIRHAIELNCIDFFRILVAQGIFYSFLEFENQKVCGNAFMFVHRSAQMLLELISLGVNLEEQIKFYGSKRMTTLSVFTYLFLQGDPAVNEIILSLKYTRSTYKFIAEESVFYNLPELEKFATKRLLIGSKVEEKEKVEDSGLSYHGF